MLYSVVFLYSLFCGFLLDCSSNSKSYDKAKSILIYCLVVFFWIFILGFQDAVGTDYFSYINIYTNVGNDVFYQNKNEYGFVYLVQVLRYLDSPKSLFFVFSVIQATAFWFLIYNLKKYRYITSIYPLIFLYFTAGGFFFQQMNTLRATTAAIFLLIALLYWFEKKHIKWILFFCLSVSLHQVSLYIFIFYLLFSKLPSSFKSRYLISVLCVSVLLLFIAKINIITPVLFKFISYFDSYSKYAQSTMVESAEIKTGLVILLKTFLLVFICFYIKIKEKKKLLLFNLGGVSFLLYLISLNVEILMRVVDFIGFLSLFPMYYFLVCKDKSIFLDFVKIMIYLLFSIVFFNAIIISPENERIYRSLLF